ncbi:hypothetical protein P7C71_g2581, partial [Lecanoromycetidae sp. Uapishka_2]
MSTKSLPNRVTRAQNGVKEEGVEAFALYSQYGIFWASNYSPPIPSMDMACLVLPDETVLFLNALRTEEAGNKSWAKVKVIGDWLGVEAYAKTSYEGVAKYLRERGFNNGKIGVENDIPHDKRTALKQHLQVDEGNLVGISPKLNDLRKVKDKDEIESADVASEFARVGAVAGIKKCMAGVTEREVQWEVLKTIGDLAVRDYGHVDCTDFGPAEGGVHYGQQCWVVGGSRRSMITPSTSDYKLKTGDLVTIGLWTVANHIHVEQEVTVCVGKASPEDRKAVKYALDANKAVFDIIKPGVPLSQLEVTGWNIVKNGGSETRLSRIGHTIGLGPHEKFSITSTTTEVCLEGMMLADEPHVFKFKGKIAQFSNTVVVTKTGARYLTTLFTPEDCGF